MSNEFVHLHVHTDYSPLDSPITVKKLVKEAKANNFKSLAITDHGTVSGWVKFYQECKDASIKPILGIEAYFTDDYNVRESRADNHHLVLLAKDDQGIRNIFRLSEISWVKGQYYDPRIDWKTLEEHKSGIICTTACVSGPLGKPIINNNIEESKKRASKFKDIFGEDFYIELQYHGLDVENEVYPKLADIAKEIGSKVVVTNDVHYLKKEDANIQEALMAISMKKCLKDPNRIRHMTNQMYLKSSDEMAKIFGFDRACIKSTLEISEKCNSNLKFGKVQLPRIDIPEGFDSDLSYLVHLARIGMKKLGLEGKKEYEDRFNHEINVIKILRDKGNQFDRYFLVVWDYVNFAWTNGIRVGTGRGSGVGSLVLYCLRITGLDPLPLDLLFERFLDENRNKMPDIDIDFCAERGDEVYQYVCKKYGSDHCSRIGTFGTYHVASSIKAAFRACDVGNTWEKEQHDKKVMEADKSRPKNKKFKGEKSPFNRDETARLSNEVTKLLPKDPSGRPSGHCTFSKETYDLNPDKIKYVYSDQFFRDLKLKYTEAMEIAEAIEGTIEKRGVHAAGVVISQDPLVDLCPQQVIGDTGSSKNSSGKSSATAFDMGDVEKLGGVKFDFLRTKALSVITRALKTIKEVKGTDVPIDHLVPDDKKVFEMFADGRTLAVFQFEGDGMRKLLREMKPTCFEDLIAANALYRPGPMEHIPTYLARKNGREKITYPVSLLEDILKPTCGILVYQEQVIKTVRILAGFTASEGDRVREAMGKKKKSILDEMKPKFLKGCINNKTCNESLALSLWETMEKFGEYAFNKSHSAGYAYTAYQTAFLKVYYPEEFMAAQLTVEGKDSSYDTVDRYWNGAKDMGIKCLPINVNASKFEYSIEGSSKNLAIRKGFSGVKGIGNEACLEIVKSQPYSDIYDFCMRSGKGTDSGVSLALLDNGGFDVFVPKISKSLGRTATKLDLENIYKESSERAKKEKNEKGARQEEKTGIGIFFGIEEDINEEKKSEKFSV